MMLNDQMMGPYIVLGVVLFSAVCGQHPNHQDILQNNNGTPNADEEWFGPYDSMGLNLENNATTNTTWAPTKSPIFQPDTNDTNASTTTTTTPTTNTNVTTTEEETNTTTSITTVDSNTTMFTTMFPILSTTAFPSSTTMSNTENIIFAILAVPSLVFAFTAYYYIKTAFFLAGGGSLGYAFYVFSPLIFPDTEFCCGDRGTETGHIVVSLGVGLIGGLIALKVLKIGVFLIGAVIGLLVGIATMFIPIVARQSFFSQAYAFALYYGSFGFVFGVLAMFMKQKILIFSSALAGTFVFLLGVDYFAKTTFNDVVKQTCVELEHKVVEQFEGDLNTSMVIDAPADHNAYIMLAAWLVLFLSAIAVQCACLHHKSKPKQQQQQRTVSQPNAGFGSIHPQYMESDTVVAMRAKYQTPRTAKRWRKNARNGNGTVLLISDDNDEDNFPGDQSWYTDN